METPVTNSASPIVQQAGFRNAAEASTSTNLRLRTSEGDVVSLALNNRLSLSESGRETRFGNGTTVNEFSATARAASQYSLTVNGDLNDQELTAIQALVDKISPIARSFFGSSNFNLEQAAASLAGSLGVIDRVELTLEKTLTASAQAFTRQAADASGDPSQTPANAADTPGNGDFAIRDVQGLVQAVVDSVFQQGDFQPPGGEGILQNLGDLKQLLNTRLLKILDPLNHPAEERQTQAASANDGTSSGTENNAPPDRLQPLSV